MTQEFLVPRLSIFVGQFLVLMHGQRVNTYQVVVGGQSVDLDKFSRRSFLTPNTYVDLTVVVSSDDDFFYYEELRIYNIFGDPLKEVRRRFKLPNEKS